MFIEKVVLYNNDVLGCISVPFSNCAKQEPDGVIFVKDVTVCGKEPDGSNHYSFIIGDNGVGKTNLLNAIANVYHNDGKMTYVGADETSTRPFIKYVGTGLYSSDNELDVLDIKVVNPNKVSVSGQILGLFCYYQKHLPLLEERLGKVINPEFGISVVYRNEVVGTKKFFRIGSLNNSNVIRAILNGVINRGDYGGQDSYMPLKDKIKSLDCYAHLISINKDIDGILKGLVSSYAAQLLRERLSPDIFDYRENAVRGNVKEMKKVMSTNRWVHYDELQPTDLLYIMLLEELGVFRITVMCNAYDRLINVNDLSTGEKIMIKLFSLFAGITEKKRKNIIFLYDEPENSLHPQWQKEFPELMRSIVEDVYHINNSHFIFATHSPQIIMRSVLLPNNYVLRMDRDEDGNVIVEPVEDIPSYNYERALLDIFDCSYYTKAEICVNKRRIDDRIRAIRDNESQTYGVYERYNRLNMVNTSLDVFDEINQMYLEIVKKTNH